MTGVMSRAISRSREDTCFLERVTKQLYFFEHSDLQKSNIP